LLNADIAFAYISVLFITSQNGRWRSGQTLWCGGTEKQLLSSEMCQPAVLLHNQWLPTHIWVPCKQRVKLSSHSALRILVFGMLCLK